MSTQQHATTPPSPWVVKYAADIIRGGDVLDLACGGGRHTRHLLERGYRVMALDINIDGLSDVVDDPGLAVMEVDLENGPWPLGNADFDAVIVTNYLWRPLFPRIREAVRPGGRVIYQTFAEGNERFGKPSNPDFLLKEGELKDWFSDWDIVAYEHGEVTGPRPAVKQSICAIRPG
ncbi:MAG: methyltransferase domain-containing protein [Alphaproteobacteria bacterium]